MTQNTLLEESLRHATAATNALASARYWLMRASENRISDFARRDRIWTARKCVASAAVSSELVQLALIAHLRESKP